MRLVTYRTTPAGQARLGAVVGGRVVDLARLGSVAGVPLPDDMLAFIDLGPDAVPVAAQLLKSHEGKWPVGTAIPFENARLPAPIPRARKRIFGIGLNYVEHVAESNRTLDTAKELPTKPVIFSKPPPCVIGPGEAIEHNKEITQQLDGEVELAVIMGR